jgi:murein DD-endopeptidase MepM/ murein hydrolase activator NlpD
MTRKKRKTYTLMFVPDDDGRTFYLRVSRFLIFSFFFFLIIFVVGISVLLLRSGEIGAKLQLTYSLLNENKQLKDENVKLRKIMTKIESIEETSIYLQRIARTIGDASLDASAAALTPPEEKVFTEDSLDTYIGDLRTESSAVYPDLKVETATRTELSLAMPNIMPVDGWITKKFYRNTDTPNDNHAGVDFAANEGTPVRATAPGVVHDVSSDTYLGKIVTVKHKYGFITRYGHCSQILVSKGDQVERGQTVALVGNTGRSTAPHVHYELLKDGKNIDPLVYILKR